MSQLIAVAVENPERNQQAVELARRLALSLTDDPSDPNFRYLLVLTGERLELRETGPRAPGPIYVDFLSGASAHRRRFGGGRGQPLARAIGLKGGLRPRVLDVTAGFGGDAFVLACLGCTVQMLERSPIIAALLEDGLARAAADPEMGSLVRERLFLTVSEGCVFMEQIGDSERPDVIYLDPMYPHRTKSALVKKEMQALRNIVGDDADAGFLLAAALGCAARRVVVKRPRRAPALEGSTPDIRIESENTRFDVYTPVLAFSIASLHAPG